MSKPIEGVWTVEVSELDALNRRTLGEGRNAPLRIAFAIVLTAPLALLVDIALLDMSWPVQVVISAFNKALISLLAMWMMDSILGGGEVRNVRKGWITRRLAQWGAWGREPKQPDPVQYASRTARFLAWLVFCPPFNWIGNMQSEVTTAQMKQIFGEYDAQPISVGLILRGPQASQSSSSIVEHRDGSM